MPKIRYPKFGPRTLKVRLQNRALIKTTWALA